ncbi:NAD(P)/FAD-dependent oxidoreductase [Myxococcota bacterium]|nr:NAD(P)/FAD-dependent oxidoreductase [Myxococcota bacterium]MBU1413475.1 NAD(P)/FAD-dependent oxidoreductase [Myxococcota bacterium]
MMYDVAIIGGGVVGCAIARELSRYHLRTVLLERFAEVGFGTTKTNSGIIHAGQQTTPGTLKGLLEVRGNAMFDQLQRELGFGFRRCGELVVASTAEEMASLERMKADGEAKGVPGLEMWDAQRLRREEPNLSLHLVGALFAPSAGVINPYEFAFALAECAVQNGVELRVEHEVQSIALRDGGGFTIHAKIPSVPDAVPSVPDAVQAGPGAVPAIGVDVEARFIINAAGVHADKVAAMVGADDFTIRPRRGEEYLLDRRLEGIVTRLIFPVPTPASKGILIIPTFDGTLMVGPTAHDQDDRFDVPTTTEGSEEVFATVRRLCPSLDARATIAEFAGLRAVSDTGDFIIGPSRVPGFFHVAGIQSPGLTASPAIAVHVVELVGRAGLPLVEHDGFNPHVAPPARFATQSHEVRQALVEADPRFGRLVCRCELVTEAEVHQAVNHGARTLDGVKFRTRAGMGRCQGGFCTTRVMQILSRRLGVPFHEVTKRGAGSWLVIPMTEDREAAMTEAGGMSAGDTTAGATEEAPCSDA